MSEDSLDTAETFRRFKLWYDWASKMDTLQKVAQWSFWMGVWSTAYLSSGVSIDPSDLEFDSFGKIIDTLNQPVLIHAWQILGYALLIYSAYLIFVTVLKIRNYGLFGYGVSIASFLILPVMFFYGANSFMVWIAVLFIFIFAYAQTKKERISVVSSQRN